MNRRTVLAAAAAGLGLALTPALAAGMKPYEATSFSHALASGPVVVHVHADWCPVCKAQKPILEMLASDAALSKVEFITVNFDKDKAFLRAHRIANQSVIVVFKNGKEVARIPGETDPARLRSGVLKAL